MADLPEPDAPDAPDADAADDAAVADAADDAAVADAADDAAVADAADDAAVADDAADVPEAAGETIASDPADAPPSGDGSDAGATTATAPARRGGLRSLDRRTIAICVVLGIAAALATLLIASSMGSDDDTNADMQLVEPGTIDQQALFAQELDTIDGGTTTLAAFEDGKPMLVNLFASNCVPCVDEMPLLTQAQTDNPDVTFVGVATQDDPDKAAALADRTEISYPWALDPTGEFFYEAQGQGMPTTILLAADGSVIDQKTGSFDNASELQAFLDQAG